jgi:hypothetical protein
MKTKFNKKIARQVAEKSFDQMLDSVLGRIDPYHDFDTPIEEYEQDFTEDMEEMNLIVTPARIKVVNTIFAIKVNKAKTIIEKLYSISAKGNK